MRDSAKRDALISIVALTAVVGGFLLLVYLPVQRACAQLQTESSAAQASIAEIPKRVMELEQLNQAIQQRLDYLSRQAHRLPRQPDLHRVVHGVSEMARTHGLQVTRLEPLEVERRSSHAVHPFRVTLRGPFSGTAAFLAGLERQSRLLTVEELRFAQDEQSVIPGILGDIKFAVYTNYDDFADFAENNDRSERVGDDS